MKSTAHPVGQITTLNVYKTLEIFHMIILESEMPNI